MSDYRTDRAFSDKLLPSVIKILAPLVGERLLTPATDAQDRLEATDVVVLATGGWRIAVRTRAHGYADRYPHEFTLRGGRRSGVPTELTKIVDNWGTWLFYGHQAAPDPCVEIDPWMVVDLAKLRSAFIRCPRLLHGPFGELSGITPNRDRETYFYWFEVERMRQIGFDVLVARSDLFRAAERDAA